VCTLAVYSRTLPGLPLVVAANRDEYLARPSAPPLLLRESPPRAVGGRDLVAGGSWLGVNDRGVVVGVLNRQSATPPDPTRRSRGQLCVELLASTSAAEAARHAAAEPAGRYNPMNLLVADREQAFVVSHTHGAAPRLQALAPGLHLLTNLDVNDSTCPRIAASHARFAAVEASFAADGDADALIPRLAAVLADHATALDPRGPGSLCIHLPAYGTRSASVLILPDAGGSVRYFHADGPPCRVALAPVAVAF
jgi:uncharacterized protein with NRDE domain